MRMSFLKGFFSSCLGAFVALILFCVIFFVVIAAISSSGGEVQIKDSSVLQLDMDGPVVEVEKENPFGGLSLFGGEEKAIGLASFRQTIEHAKTDPKIKGIY